MLACTLATNCKNCIHYINTSIFTLFTVHAMFVQACMAVSWLSVSLQIPDSLYIML